MSEAEENPLIISLKEVNLIIGALNEYYLRMVYRAQRDKREFRSKKISEELAFIQKTLQHLMVYNNIRTGKLYAESPETADNTGDQELAGDT